MSRGQTSVQDLCRIFSEVRKLKQAAHTLGVERHPSIVANPSLFRRGGPAKLHPVLAHIFYHCDSEDMYRSLKEYADHDKKAKGRRLPHVSLPGSQKHSKSVGGRRPDGAQTLIRMITVKPLIPLSFYPTDSSVGPLPT